MKSLLMFPSFDMACWRLRPSGYGGPSTGALWELWQYQTSSCNVGLSSSWFTNSISADFNASELYLPWQPRGRIGNVRLRPSVLFLLTTERVWWPVRGTIPVLFGTRAVTNFATFNGPMSIVMRHPMSLRHISWSGFQRSSKQEEVRTGPTQGGTWKCWAARTPTSFLTQRLVARCPIHICQLRLRQSADSRCVFRCRHRVRRRCVRNRYPADASYRNQHYSVSH